MKIGVRVPVEGDIPDMIPVFQRWIREKALPGILIDAVDYRHVRGGPGVHLACHRENYSMGEAGLCYQGENTPEGALESLARARRLLEKEGVTFGDAMEFWINDRLDPPETIEIAGYSVEKLSRDPRERVSFRIRASAQNI